MNILNQKITQLIQENHLNQTSIIVFQPLIFQGAFQRINLAKWNNISPTEISLKIQQISRNLSRLLGAQKLA